MLTKKVMYARERSALVFLTDVSFFFVWTEGAEHHRYTAEHDKCQHDEHYRLPGQDIRTFWQNKVISVLVEEYCCSSWYKKCFVWSTFLLVVVLNCLRRRFVACEWQDQQNDWKWLACFGCWTKNPHVLSKSPLKNIHPPCQAKHLGPTDRHEEEEVLPSPMLSLVLFERYGGISVGGVNSQVRLTEEEVESIVDDLRKLFAAYQVCIYK